MRLQETLGIYYNVYYRNEQYRAKFFSQIEVPEFRSCVRGGSTQVLIVIRKLALGHPDPVHTSPYDYLARDSIRPDVFRRGVPSVAVVVLQSHFLTKESQAGKPLRFNPALEAYPHQVQALLWVDHYPF